MLDQPDMSLPKALYWVINAKNALKMWSGFSSYQLVFGRNPNMPSILTDNPPALEGTTINHLQSTFTQSSQQDQLSLKLNLVKKYEGLYEQNLEMIQTAGGAHELSYDKTGKSYLFATVSI